MNNRRNTVWGILATAALAVLVLTGCRAFEPEVVIVNKAPETYIVGAPMEEGGGYYHFHVFWYGSDADGRVERFVWALTDTTVQDPLTTDDEEDQRFNPALDASTLEIGHWTTRTDSIFDFRIDQGTRPSADLTLHMVAIDDFGDYDRTPARLHFFSNTLGTPVIRFYRVDQQSGDTVRIAVGETDTVGYGKPYSVAWFGSSPNILGYDPDALAKVDTVYPYDDGLFGYKWQLLGDLGNCGASQDDCWHPRRFDPASNDSFSYFGDVTRLDFANESPLSDNPFERLLPSGPVNLLVNSVDVAGVEVIDFRREFSFVVNRDPETRMLDYETHGTDPQRYPFYVSLTDPATRVAFHNGDTIPDRSYVVVKALGRDSADDVQVTANGVGLEGFVTGQRAQIGGGRFNFSTGSSPLNRDLGLPDANGWYADTLGFLVGPRTTYTFNMTAVDEHDRRDGTPAQLRFYVGGQPCVQCVELKAKASQVSDFPDPNLDCYHPGGAATACMDGSRTRLQITQGAAGTDDLEFVQPAFFVVEKATKFVSLVTDTTGMSATHFVTNASIYRMQILLHGRDADGERWADPRWRTMAWRYQVDYECDPDNQIKDGGGTDDIGRVTYGDNVTDGLTVTPDGLWKMSVDVAIPSLLFQYPPDIYRQAMAIFNPGISDELADALYWGSLRQLGDGTVRAVALDQTNCAATPAGRPASYNYFKNVRPEIATPPAPLNWRSCVLKDQGAAVPNLARPLDLAPGAMESDTPAPDYDWRSDPDGNPWTNQDGTPVRGEPVTRDFRVVLIGVNSLEIDCNTPPVPAQ